MARKKVIKTVDFTHSDQKYSLTVEKQRNRPRYLVKLTFTSLGDSHYLGSIILFEVTEDQPVIPWSAASHTFALFGMECCVSDRFVGGLVTLARLTREDSDT